MSRALRVLKGVAALLALVGMVVGVPLFLVKAAGWPLPSHLPSPQAVGDALTRNGVPAEVIVKAVAVVIWLAWAQLVLSVAVEVVALARHRQLGRVRGLGGSRVLAASLVTTAAALLSAFGSLRPAGAVVAARPAPALAVRPSAAAPVAAPGGRTWTVRPRDTFWSIAEATLGAGERWREIERLNRGREVAAGVVLLPGTDLLRAGWTLRLPAAVEPGDVAAHGRGRGSKPPTTALAPAPAPTAAPSAAPTPAPTPVPGTHPAPGPDPTGPASPPAPAPPAPVSMPAATPVAEPVAEIARPPQAAGRLVTSPGDAAIGTAIELVRVRAGDTLSSIALRVYGDPHQWPRIWEANRDRLFGHHRFTDPDVIMAGWVLDVPLTETPPPPARPMGVTVERVSTRGHVHLDRLPDRVDPAAAVPAAAPSVGPLPTAMSTPVAAPQPRVAASASGPAAGGGELTQSLERSEEASVRPSPDRGEASVNPWAVSTGVLSAGLLATGVVGLVGSRRRRRLERAPLRAVAPVPDPDLAHIERAARLGANPAAAARVDAALRALAAGWRRTEMALRPLSLRRHRSGDLALTLAGPARPTAPWRATDRADVWTLPADVPLGDLVSQASGVPSPCPALVLLGVDEDSELYVDLEALGTLVIDGPPEAARAIARAVVASLAVSPLADRVQVVAAGADCYGFANHGQVQAVADAGAALEVAGCLVGPLQRALDAERVPSTLVLRACQPAELWEPTVVVALAAASDPVDAEALASMAGPGGRGLALVTDVPVPGATWRLRLDGDRWALVPLAGAVAPQGLAADELADLGALLVDASAPLPEAPTAVRDLALPGPYREHAWELLVRVLGPVDVVDRAGGTVTFERSKGLELVVWLAHHRSHPTRSGARTALWESDVRDATFANIVSDARRALARFVPPPAGEEWIGRTYGDELPLHPLVATDVELLEARLTHARNEPDDAVAVGLLREGLSLVRDLPYTGTSFLWTDAGAWPSHVTLLVINAAAEMANRCLAGGDVEGVFWATDQGMRVLPAHDELVCLRLRAHAAQGNLAGLRHEFTSYERGLTADPWGDGEPSPKVVATRNELLRAATMGPAA